MLRVSVILLASGLLCLLFGIEGWGISFGPGRLLLFALTGASVLAFLTALIQKASSGPPS